MSYRVLFGRHSHIFAAAVERVSADFALFSSAIADVESVNFDFYIPLTLCDFDEVKRSGARFRHKALIPTPHAVEACHDKLAFVTAMLDSGMGRYIPAIHTELSRFPYVLKKRKADFGHGTRLVKSVADHNAILGSLSSPDYFAQALVRGEIEHATHVLMAAGRPVYHFTALFRMLTDCEIKGVGSHGAFIGAIDASLHVTLFADILNMLGFNEGVCCIDYKIINGIPQIFEINPRFGGSLTMDITRFLTVYANAVRHKSLGLSQPLPLSH